MLDTNKYLRAILWLLFCCFVLSSGSHCIAGNRYNIKAISVSIPRYHQTHCTKNEFFLRLERAGLKFVYDSVSSGSYYYDTSEYAPNKLAKTSNNQYHYWRVFNYHYLNDTVPEIDFIFSEKKGKGIITPANHDYMIPYQPYQPRGDDQNITAARTDLYYETHKRYERIVRRHFIKEFCCKQK